MKADAVKIVTAGVLECDGRVLIVRRAPGQLMAGSWEFPGGSLEADESPEDCLQRELREELALECEVGLLLGVSRHSYPRGSIDLHFYHVPRWRGTVRLSVHDRLSWVAIAELDAYEFSPADRPFVAHLLAAGRVVPMQR